MNLLKLSLVLALAGLISAQTPTADLVDLTQLLWINTTFTNYTAPIYSGYLYVNPQKQLHYFFFESQSSPSSDPLVLWLNGGPGCSSLLGALYEHGPFVFPDGSQDFQWNNYSWNLHANVIYMEAPACVGFSYIADYTLPFNDTNTAQDNLLAVLSWFAKFPGYSNRTFFIAGESYGGIYVPTLAAQIVWYNEQNPSSPINLKGIAVGNGVTDWEYDTTPADWDFYWNHALYSPAVRQQYETYCLTNPQSSQCGAATDAVNSSTYWINNYDIYRPCFGLNSSITQIDGVTNVDYARFRKLKRYTVGGTEIDAPGAAPCVDSVGAYYFLNNASVRESFHIYPNITTDWFMCTDNCNYTPNANASFWAYPILLEAGIRIMFYSGDVDGSVPTIGSQRWITNLVSQYNIPVVNPMNYWTLPGNLPTEPQVAGYVTDYLNFRFVTVKGAGHMVPQWQREGAYKMFYAFLNDVDLN